MKELEVYILKIHIDKKRLSNSRIKHVYFLNTLL